VEKDFFGEIEGDMLEGTYASDVGGGILRGPGSEGPTGPLLWNEVLAKRP